MTNEEKWDAIKATLQQYISPINSQKSLGHNHCEIDMLDYPEVVDYCIKVLEKMGLIISEIVRYEKPLDDKPRNQNIATKFTVTWGTDFTLIGLK